mmetsp:Transcript_73427/g.129568  ORF Transcript_73427/g.129568 Transcript_73427/m.129568 type:complete len:206 (+) Transcript_73427:381-998(+)
MFCAELSKEIPVQWRRCCLASRWSEELVPQRQLPNVLWPLLWIVSCTALSDLFEDLNLSAIWEEWCSCQKLTKDAASAPNIHPCVIVLGAQEKFRWPIPERDDSRGVVACSTEGARQAKVAEFQLTLPCQENIGWLQVPVHDVVEMAKVQSIGQLPDNALDLWHLQFLPVMHVACKIMRCILKDEIRISWTTGSTPRRLSPYVQQ